MSSESQSTSSVVERLRHCRMLETFVSTENVINNGASQCVETVRGVCGYGPKRDLTFDRLNYKTIGNLAVRKRLVESVLSGAPSLQSN